MAFGGEVGVSAQGWVFSARGVAVGPAPLPPSRSQALNAAITQHLGLES